MNRPGGVKTDVGRGSDGEVPYASLAAAPLPTAGGRITSFGGN